MSELVATDEFREALDVLDAGSHLFLTGKAGTGKSTLIRPIDIAVAYPDGTTIESVVNPTRDSGTSAQEYEITASDHRMCETRKDHHRFGERIWSGYGCHDLSAAG